VGLALLETARHTVAMGQQPTGGLVDADRPVVRAALALYDAMNRDDRAGVLALLHENVEILSAGARAVSVDDVQSGHAGMRRLW
jgi:hypothetical protein